MPDAHANFAYSTVATAPSPATSGTSLVVASGDGALFPAVPFNAVICPAGTQPTAANAEIVRVTASSTDTFSTIVRQQEGTGARTVVVGDQIFAAITAKTLTDVETPTLARSSNYITADVTMVTAGTYYDGPSLTLAAGTYLLVGAIVLVASTSAVRIYNTRLWDGSTVSAYGEFAVPGTAAAGRGTVPMNAFVSPGGSTTYKISATSTVNGDFIKGAAPYDKSSYLLAIRIA